VCEYYAHEDCKDFAVNDCKETATYAPSRDNVRSIGFLRLVSYFDYRIFLFTVIDSSETPSSLA